MRVFPQLTTPSNFGVTPWYRDPRVWSTFSSVSLLTTLITFRIGATSSDESTWNLLLRLHIPLLVIELLALLCITLKYPFLSDTISTTQGENVFVPLHSKRSITLLAVFVQLAKFVWVIWHTPFVLVFGHTSLLRSLCTISSYLSYIYNITWTAYVFWESYLYYDNWDQTNVPSQWTVLTHRTTLQSLPTNIAFFSQVKSRIYGGSVPDDDSLEEIGLLGKSQSFIITNPSHDRNFPKNPSFTINGQTTSTTSQSTSDYLQTQHQSSGTYANFDQHDGYSQLSNCAVTDVYLDPSIHTPDLSQTGSDVYDLDVPIQALDIPSLIHIAGIPTVEPSSSTTNSDVTSTGSDTTGDFGYYSPPVITNPSSDDLP